jgi:hypothetical protein
LLHRQLFGAKFPQYLAFAIFSFKCYSVDISVIDHFMVLNLLIIFESWCLDEAAVAAAAELVEASLSKPSSCLILQAAPVLYEK